LEINIFKKRQHLKRL